MKRKLRKIASIIYIAVALVLLYIGFVGAELNRMELSIPCLIGMIGLLILRHEVANVLRAKAQRKLWLRKYKK